MGPKKTLTPHFSPDQNELQAAWQQLLEIIRPLEQVAVAFSGGADSGLLLAACVAALGPQKVRAVHCAGEFTPPWERQRAQSMSAELEVELIELDAAELSEPRITCNDELRCYWCKHLRMGKLRELAKQWGVENLVEGSQADDAKENRPGEQAIREQGVLSPLAKAGLGKEQVRALSAALGLPTAQTPSSACLASRVPRGRVIDSDSLVRIAMAEAALRPHFQGRLRVRDHFPMARIELEPDQMVRAAADPLRGLVMQACRDAGYAHACLDLAGYTTGGADIVSHPGCTTGQPDTGA